MSPANVATACTKSIFFSSVDTYSIEFFPVDPSQQPTSLINSLAVDCENFDKSNESERSLEGGAEIGYLTLILVVLSV